MRRLLEDHRIPGTVVALVAFALYLRTLAPGLTFIDSGELAAVACTLGVAHPTGYPLFTLLGWIVTHIPPDGDQIYRLNVMAAFFCAGGIYCFYQVLLVILGSLRQGSRNDPTGLRVGAAGGSFLLAFSSTYWEQAVSVEVYSLHVFFISLLLLLFLRASSLFRTGAQAGAEDPSRGGKRWLVFAFVVGLAFTNHMTTIYLAPGLITLFFMEHGFNRSSGRLLLRMAPPFLLGLSLYLYLPLRASESPLFNWGDPVTLDRLLRHLSGKQYSIWFFTSAENMGRQFSLFVDSLPKEFSIVGLPLVAAGFILLWKRDRRMSVLLSILFATCVLFAVNYDIYDIASYFLLSFLILAIWGGVGIRWLFDLLKKYIGSRTVSAVVVLALSLVPLVLHFSDRDESGNFLVEDYASNMLTSVEKNALVISYQWDFWVSASYYLQYVRGVRTDVTVVDKELLRRSWYLKELGQRHPWLMTASAAEVEAFRNELFKFEHGLPYDPNLIQKRFVDMIRSFIEKSIPDRPVYVTQEIEPEFVRGFQRVPVGLAFRLERGDEFRPVPFPSFHYREFPRKGRLENQTRSLYAEMLVARGGYYYKRDRKETERSLLEALRYDPESKSARGFLERLKRERNGGGGD